MPSGSSVQEGQLRHFPVQSPIIFVSYNEGADGRRNDDLFPRRNRRVLILYVGGTIGMLRVEGGALKPCKGYLTQMVKEIKELKERPEIAPFDIIEYDELLDSSDMDKRDYTRIAADIAQQYDNYDGFLVLHGTDTMHYTASALSFQLMNLDKPVVLTGSMVPLVEPYSDARRNFVISLMLASNPIIREVCVFFNDCLLRGNRCCKLHHSFGAFASPNYPALGVMEGSGFSLRGSLLLPQARGPLTMQSDMRGRVLVIVVHPEWDAKTFLQLISECTPDATATQSETDQNNTKPSRGKPLVDGVVFEMNGVGSLNSCCTQSLHQMVTVGQSRGIVMCVTTREPFGFLSLLERRRLRAISPHLVYLHDMTSAAAEVKLMYLFGKGLLPETVAREMPLNLRGEVTPTAPMDGKL